MDFIKNKNIKKKLKMLFFHSHFFLSDDVSLKKKKREEKKCLLHWRLIWKRLTDGKSHPLSFVNALLRHKITVEVRNKRIFSQIYKVHESFFLLKYPYMKCQ